jgi:hypothetical protein
MTQDEINRAHRLTELPEEWQNVRSIIYETIKNDVYPRKHERIQEFENFFLDLWGRVQPGA